MVSRGEALCQSEAVAYAKFKKEHPQLAFLGINRRRARRTRPRSFVDKYDWDWPSIHDPRLGRWPDR